MLISRLSLPKPLKSTFHVLGSDAVPPVDYPESDTTRIDQRLYEDGRVRGRVLDRVGDQLHEYGRQARPFAERLGCGLDQRRAHPAAYLQRQVGDRGPDRLDEVEGQW